MASVSDSDVTLESDVDGGDFFTSHRNGEQVDGLSISFQDLEMSVPPSSTVKGAGIKSILKKVSGVIRKGRFTALLGPTGSGKTSLLNVLAGRTKKVKGLSLSGTISVGSQPVQDWSAYRRQVAYVEQDDLLFANLSVRETLSLAAEFRLPRAFTPDQRRDRVDAVIQELGLLKCADTKIGSARIRGVSGGERKRVSVAVSILNGPSCILLDECTSGLDSFQALRVCTTIKRLATAGRTVVSSVHQPRSAIYQLFDDVVILSEGSIMYAGPGAEMVEYFSKLKYQMPSQYNPSDYVLDIVSMDVRTPALEQKTRDRINALDSAFRNGFSMKSVEVDKSAKSLNELKSLLRYEAPYWKQCALLARRAVTQKLRDPAQIRIPIIVNIVFGTLLGVVYFRTGENLSQAAIGDKSGILFFLALNLFFQGVFSVIAVFGYERDIVNRERSAKSYSVLPYYFSKVVSDLPSLLFPTLLITLAYWLSLLSTSPQKFFETLILGILSFECAASFGLVVASLTPSPEVAQALAMPMMLIFVLFSGFYANTNLIPVFLAWIQWIAPIRWSFAGFCVIQFTGVVFECRDPQNEGCVPTGEAVIKRLGFAEDSFGKSLGVLLGMIAFLQISGYVILRVKRPRYVNPKPSSVAVVGSVAT